MNDTFLAFLSDQILPPFGAAMAAAFCIALLAPFWPALRLWALAGRVALFGLAMLPGVGLVPALVLDLLDRDHTALVMAVVVTVFALPLALWGAPVCSCPCPAPTGWSG